MSPRAWLAACLLAAVFGGLIGWSARIATVYDRERVARIAALEARINRDNIEAETMIAEAQAKIEREKHANTSGN